MLPQEVIRKIRRIQITSNRLVDESLAGEYHSVFKGRGMEFDEVREYQAGDDVRMIDWNVTSRAGRLFVKRYVEERELTVMLLIDMSASEAFGSASRTKAETAAEISALIAFSAIRNNDRVGAILFTDRVERFIPPRRGTTHVLRVVREVLFHKPENRGTSIRQAIEHLNLIIRRHAVVFLISDLLDQGYEKPLRATNKKHDVVVIQIVDPRESELPNVGILELQDSETGEVATLDTSLPRVRERFRENWLRNQSKISRLFEANRIDHIAIETDKPYDVPLVRFFARRAERNR